MGKVMCPRHGGVIGQMACRHIDTALMAEQSPPPIVYVRVYFGDLFDFKAAICDACCQSYNLDEASEIDVEALPEDFSGEGLPDTVPVCPRCFAES
jgi:hypothetical protein